MTRDRKTRVIRWGLALALLATLAGAGEAVADDGWEWGITPYAWLSDISEDLLVDGSVVGGNDLSFSDVLDTLEGSLMLHVEGMGERWGVFGEIFYVDIRDEEVHEPLIIDAQVEETTLELGVVWRAFSSDDRAFDVLLGARQFQVDERYTFTQGDDEPVDARVDEDFLDALVGARYVRLFGDRWLVSASGDFSFGDSDLFWTAELLGGWRYGNRKEHVVLFGYRHREMEYTKDAFEVERTLSGAILGLRIGAQIQPGRLGES